MKNRIVLTYEIENDEYLTVGEWLFAHGFPKKTMKEIFQSSGVRLNGRPVTAKDSLCSGMTLMIGAVKESLDYEPIPMELIILYEDEDILVIHKPVGLTMNSKGQMSLANGVAAYFQERHIHSKVRFLNRLDRDTSGCVVVPKHGLAQHFYQQQMDDNTFEKWYRAEVIGRLEPQHNVVELRLRKSEDGIHQEVHPQGVMTKTEYDVISYDANTHTSTVRIRLWTGKTHQIRVTMAHLGHSLVHDELYGGAISSSTEQPFSLVAYEIKFNHLRTNERIIVRVKDSDASI